MSFASLKKASSTGNTLAKLTQEIEKLNQPQSASSNVDERLWKPELDKSGNGYAVIRFLPAPDGEELPFAKVWSHAFKGPGGQWYIENSLTTLGKQDPVSEYNTELWNAGGEGSSQRAQARAQKRKLSYYSNIYVVSDPTHPENEGRVFLYKYGKKIFDKLVEAMQPAFADEKALDPFNFWEGADFKLKIRKVDGYWNYDKSEFADPSALFDNDEEIEALWKTEYSLADFTAASNFKSYDELKTRLDAVLAGTVTVGKAEDIMEDAPVAEPKVDTPPAPQPTVLGDAGEDDAMSYFEKLANE